MKKEGLCLLILFSVLLPTVIAAGGVTLQQGQVLNTSTNLTFKINNTIMFESPVAISNDGYALFGQQNFSVAHTLTDGPVVITILNYTNSSSVTNGTNFWFFIEGQNQVVNISIDHIPGVTNYIVFTNNTGETNSTVVNDYETNFTFSFNATSEGKYVRIGFAGSVTTTTLSSGGGGGGGSAARTTTTTTTVQQQTSTTQIVVTTIPVTPTTLQETTTTLQEIKPPEKQPYSAKVLTVFVLILVTVAVIIWLFRSLKEDGKKQKK